MPLFFTRLGLQNIEFDHSNPPDSPTPSHFYVHNKPAKPAQICRRRAAGAAGSAGQRNGPACDQPQGRAGCRAGATPGGRQPAARRSVDRGRRFVRLGGPIALRNKKTNGDRRTSGDRGQLLQGGRGQRQARRARTGNASGVGRSGVGNRRPLGVFVGHFFPRRLIVEQCA